MKYLINNILESNNKKFKNNEYIFEKINGKYQGKTYNEFYSDVKKVAAFLQVNHNIDDIIIMYGDNSYNYMVVDAAIMGYTCISATLSKEWTFEDLENSINLMNPKSLVFSAAKKNVVDELKDKYPNINFYEIENIIPDTMGDLDTKRIDGTKPSKLIFSSGTTGVPKGVLLTQDNMFDSYDNLGTRAPMDNNDVDYMFLPLSHTYANIWNFMISMISGMKLYLCSDTKLIFNELAEVKPTVFCAVPLIYERLYKYCTENNVKPSLMLGGNIKYAFTGGACLKSEIRKYLMDDNINLLSAYGLTETSSLVSLSYSHDVEYESVGIPLENCIVKINEPNSEGIGEVIVKGKNIFNKYFNNDYLTGKAIDSEGYFYTGDLGYLKDNRLYIVGRKKRVIIYSNGENIYPDDIEALFINEKINKVKVFDNGGVLTANIYVSEIIDVEDMIEEINKKLPKFSKIKKYNVILDDISKRMK